MNILIYDMSLVKGLMKCGQYTFQYTVLPNSSDEVFLRTALDKSEDSGNLFNFMKASIENMKAFIDMQQPFMLVLPFIYSKKLKKDYLLSELNRGALSCQLKYIDENWEKNITEMDALSNTCILYVTEFDTVEKISKALISIYISGCDADLLNYRNIITII